MEEQSPTPSEQQQITPTPPVVKTPITQKKKFLVFLLAAILLFSAGLGYMLVSPKKTHTTRTISPTPSMPSVTPAPSMPAAAATVSLSPSATVVPTVPLSKASKSAAFLSYNVLSGEEKFAVASNFTDAILQVSLAYPPGYFMKSYKADATHKIAELFFAKNEKDVQTLQYVVDCVVENRKDPSGVCVEGSVGDVAVTIAPYQQHDNILYHDGNPLCQRDINTSSRVLFSCETAMSVDASDIGMRYILYFLQDNPLQVTVSARDPKTHAHLIRSIVSSVANHVE